MAIAGEHFPRTTDSVQSFIKVLPACASRTFVNTCDRARPMPATTGAAAT